MLYDRWREIAREFAHELALRDLPTGRSWTFQQLADAGDQKLDSPIVFPRGNTAEFVIDVLRAWRSQAVVCPLEPNQPGPNLPAPPREIAHLKLTSATSGAAKVVALTAEQPAADAANIVSTMGLRRDWPNLAFISLAHSYGFSNLITPLLLHGIPLVLGGEPFPESVRGAQHSRGNVTLAAVPALWSVWHAADAITNGVRLGISAGAPLPIALEKDVFVQRGLKIHNFYGASECGGIAYDRSDRPRADAMLAGTALDGVNLTVGEGECLEVRGASVAETYWPERMPTLQRGVYRTSDLAAIANGTVFLRGRAGDVINVAARKIAPETIERSLSQHPSVADCLVFGVAEADSQRGDVIVACVELRDHATTEELRQFLLVRSGAWQVPREFFIVPSLAPNQRGKLSRAEWRARFLAWKNG